MPKFNKLLLSFLTLPFLTRGDTYAESQHLRTIQVVEDNNSNKTTTATATDIVSSNNSNSSSFANISMKEISGSVTWMAGIASVIGGALGTMGAFGAKSYNTYKNRRQHHNQAINTYEDVVTCRIWSNRRPHDIINTDPKSVEENFKIALNNYNKSKTLGDNKIYAAIVMHILKPDENTTKQLKDVKYEMEKKSKLVGTNSYNKYLKLTELDNRYPTLYAHLCYHLGKSNKNEGLIEEAIKFRELIDEYKQDKYQDNSKLFANDYYNSYDVSDTLIFKRSGRILNKIEELKNEALPDIEKFDKTLKELQELKDKGDQCHQNVCLAYEAQILQIKAEKLISNPEEKKQIYNEILKLLINDDNPDNIEKNVKNICQDLKENKSYYQNRFGMDKYDLILYHIAKTSIELYKLEEFTSPVSSESYKRIATYIYDELTIDGSIKKDKNQDTLRKVFNLNQQSFPIRNLNQDITPLSLFTSPFLTEMTERPILDPEHPRMSEAVSHSYDDYRPSTDQYSSSSQSPARDDIPALHTPDSRMAIPASTIGRPTSEQVVVRTQETSSLLT